MPPFLVVNPRSGGGSPTPEELVAEADRLGIRSHVLGDGDDATGIARTADADALGAAGGDGTLGAVAAAALERDVPFACVPFGTRNHFARDVGLDPGDPLAALASFSGRERRIDVGRIGERVFLNNVSFGLYASLVHRRERHRRRREAHARLLALWIVLHERRPIRLTLDGRPQDARVVLISNNRYDLHFLSLGERARLDEGVLSVYVAAGLLPRHWEGPDARRSVAVGGPASIAAAVDGDPVELELPAQLSVEPLALRLLVPVSSE